MSEYRYWFTLKGYRVISQSQALERRLWDIFPQRCLTFWPYLLSDRTGIKDFLERDIPVTVDTKMDGLGHFTTRIDWLTAWVKVEWRGHLWCISNDGKMWLYERGRKNDDSTGRLVWKIPDEGNAQDGATLQTPMTGVFRSPIDTGVIASFLDEFRGYEWFSEASEITWERRAGMDLFILRVLHGTQRIEIYIQREKYSGQDVGAQIDILFARLINEGGNHVIDATYEGKILLRNL
ncbi:MAG: hypothetical protein IJG65_09800 [Synergistaceae bacterium]|nr:hypothetical protein [Synergistaceae bacterium]